MGHEIRLVKSRGPYNSLYEVKPLPLLFEKQVRKAELAKHLSISESYINRLMNSGMPTVRIGRSVRFRISEVVAWLEKRST